MSDIPDRTSPHNLSTEHQKPGDAKRPRDTLDSENDAAHWAKDSIPPRMPARPNRAAIGPTEQTTRQKNGPAITVTQGRTPLLDASGTTSIGPMNCSSASPHRN